jgi:protocatechuate 3,4-dioxygenase beta subunit
MIMTARRVLWTLSAAAALLVGAAQAQAQSGSVVGTVYDSIDTGPLPDAAVFLWDTPYRTVTDTAGRFRIEDVPPGEYSILFFHTRLGEMGVSPGPTLVSVAPADSSVVELATPSMFTLVSSQCLLEERGESTGVLAGWVGDGSTGTGLPGAEVTLSWNVPDELGPRHLSLLTEANGWYRTCQAPAGVPLMAEAHFLDRHGLRREISVSENGFTQAAFLLYRLTNGRVAGRLLDGATNAAVSGAEVWLRGTGVRGLTDSDGDFLFEDVPPGTYMLMSNHLAYGTKMDTLAVPAGARIRAEMRLDTRPIEIAPVTVTVEASQIRERARGGVHITADQVEAARQGARDAADILLSQHIPGILIRRRSGGQLCVGYGQGQVRMMFNDGCVPMMVFINDARASNNDMALLLPPDAIDRMVIYKPVEAGNLFGLGGGNGVLMIYTKGN